MRRWHRPHIRMGQSRHRAGWGIRQQCRQTPRGLAPTTRGPSTRGPAQNLQHARVGRRTVNATRHLVAVRSRMLRLKLRHSAPRRGEPTAEERALRAAYWTDAVSVLRRRLDLTAALFLLFVGVAMLAEMFSYPERARIVALVYGAEVA